LIGLQATNRGLPEPAVRSKLLGQKPRIRNGLSGLDDVLDWAGGAIREFHLRFSFSFALNLPRAVMIAS